MYEISLTEQVRMRHCTLRKNTVAAYQIDTGHKPSCTCACFLCLCARKLCVHYAGKVTHPGMEQAGLRARPATARCT
jgi:hypothetical protein